MKRKKPSYGRDQEQPEELRVDWEQSDNVLDHSSPETAGQLIFVHRKQMGQWALPSAPGREQRAVPEPQKNDKHISNLLATREDIK